MLKESETQRGSGDPDPAADSGGKWWPLVAVCTAIFMLLLDITVVNVALPDIQRDLNASFDSLQWVIDAYALTLASFQLITGVLGDRLGRRPVFTTGIAIFAVASLACGVAQSALWLDVARAAQGVGGSIMFANSLAILGTTYRGRDRGTAFGIWGATTGASVAIGPLVGGALTTGVGWRWIFFVNLPIAAAAIALSLLRLDRARGRADRRLDLPGFGLFSGSLALLIYALIRGNDAGWASGQILGVLGAAAAAMVAFLVVESRTQEPMLDLRSLPRSFLPRRPGRRVRDLGLPVRTVPLPHALPPGHPRLQRTAGRSADAADLGPGVPGGADRRQAQCPGALPWPARDWVARASAAGLALMTLIRPVERVAGPAARLRARRGRDRDGQRAARFAGHVGGAGEGSPASEPASTTPSARSASPPRSRRTGRSSRMR